MSIPVDTYFIVTPGSEFLSKAYVNMNGTDVFFYVTETGALRAVNMNSTNTTASPGLISYTLAQGAVWCGAVTVSGLTHVYYADASGNMFHIPYSTLGGQVIVTALSGLASALNFSVIFTPQSSPPVYLLMIDDGIRHNLYVSATPTFTTLLAPATVTYNNAISHSVYVSKPTIAMHPLDTTRITVTTESTVIMTSVNNVGFYEVRVPGLN